VRAESPGPEILSYEDLRRRADAFLAEHHPSLSIPVPIEEIVEFQLGMDIIPVPGLHQAFEIDGFTTSDLGEISVDQYVYESRPGRYRFTLAHEVGHVLLHRHIYEARSFTSIGEWKEFVDSISETDYGWLEYQAYAFGGLVLVQSGPLIGETNACVQRIQGEGIDVAANWDFAWTRIAAFLAKSFDVSTGVVEKRLVKDGIPQLFAGRDRERLLPCRRKG